MVVVGGGGLGAKSGEGVRELHTRSSLVARTAKNLPPVLETWVRSLGWEDPLDGYPLQYSCLENPMDRGAWWAKAHGVAKNWT